jgi:hypothetical protein
VLRLWDDRTGSYAELAVRASVPLRVCIRGPAGGTWSGPADLRVMLTADVLIRIAELQGLQVISVLAALSQPPDGFGQDVSALGIHPPATCTSPGNAEASLGGPAHVHVAGKAAGAGDHGSGVLIGVGRVAGQAYQEAAGVRSDPFALRLALLSSPYRQPVQLTQANLAEAAESVRRWRAKVAGWAGEPSRPIAAETAAKIRDAFDEDLDTAAALGILSQMESAQDVPAGMKFETFVFVDRVLGLELAREIGR